MWKKTDLVETVSRWSAVVDLSVCSPTSHSNTDKPDASAILLHDFQRFLVYEQKVKSAPPSDQLRYFTDFFLKKNI